MTIALLLVPLAFVLDGEGTSRGPSPAGGAAAPVPDIAGWSRRSAGCAFEGAPEVRRVTPAQARAEAGRDARRGLPARAPRGRGGGARHARAAAAGLRPRRGHAGGASTRRSPATRPAVGCAPGHRGRADGGPRALRDARSRTSSRTRSTTSTSTWTRTRSPRAATPGSRTSRWSRAPPPRCMNRYMAARFSAEEALGASLGSVLAGLGNRHRGHAAVPRGANALPLHGRRGLREPAARDRRRRLEGRRRRDALPPAGLHRAGPPPGEVPRRSSSPTASPRPRCAAGRCSSAPRWGSG